MLPSKMTATNNTGDDILFMDDINEDVSKPLTLKPVDARMVRSRSGSLRETDNVNNPRPTSGPEIDDLEDDGKLPIGFESRLGIDDDLLPELPRVPPRQLPYFPQPPIITTPDVNVYQHKKTLAQGMMDLALLSANANQLRYVLQTDGGHPYYFPSLAMIGASLLLQIVVGIGLIWNSRYNVKDDAQMCKADRANNWTVIGIFLVTILNVFISSFGVVDEVATASSTPTT